MSKTKVLISSEQVEEYCKKLTTQKALSLYLITVMLALPFMEFLTELFKVRFVTQIWIMELAGVYGLLVMFLHYYFTKGRKLYSTDISYFALMLLALLSLIFSKDYYQSFFSYDYDEDIIEFSAYFALMCAASLITEEKYRRNVLKAFVIVIAFHSFIAAGQPLNLRLTEAYYGGEGTSKLRTCYGLTQNTNWYGGLSCLFCACTSGIFLFSENRKIRIGSYFLTLFCFYTLIFSDARLAWAGAIVYLLFYLISILIMHRNAEDKQIIRIYLLRYFLLLAGCGAVIAASILGAGRIINRIEKTKSELNSDSDGYGSHRGYIWKYGLEAIPKNWLFGTGLDNYIYAFDSNPRYHVGDFAQYKGHNEYLHYLVTQGVFQFLNYMTLLVHAAVISVKSVLHDKNRSERALTWIFLGMFFAYAAQAFFNSSIINVVPYFWITVGMCETRKHHQPLKWQPFEKKTDAA